MKKPRIVKTRELVVEERAPPGPPEWRIVEYRKPQKQQAIPKQQPKTPAGFLYRIKRLFSAFREKTF